MTDEKATTDKANITTLSIRVPAGTSLGEIVEAYIRAAFAAVAELYGDTEGKGNPTITLLRDESRLLAAWQKIRESGTSEELSATALLVSRFAHPEYGAVGWRECAECGKPYPAWTADSRLLCPRCRLVAYAVESTNHEGGRDEGHCPPLVLDGGTAGLHE